MSEPDSPRKKASGSKSLPTAIAADSPNSVSRSSGRDRSNVDSASSRNPSTSVPEADPT
jgi:hypothetical protein